MEPRRVLLLLLAILVAVTGGLAVGLLAIGRLAVADTAPPVRGGAAAVDGGRSANTHPIGEALHKYAKTLAVFPAHPLNEDHYTAASVGGAVKPKKKWGEYPSWSDLLQDKGATNEYIAARANAIENPDFDWEPVLAVMRPKLEEDREYIGVANVGPDGRTMHVVASAASPTTAKEESGRFTFASVPAALVAEYGSIPGLFLFHTHPSSLACCQLPSPHDLAAAIQFGAATQYAGHAVISRYGVTTYGLDWSAYKAIHEAKDPQLAKLHYVHDVVTAHETMRSWVSWSIPKHLKFYSKYRLFVNSYPSGQMVGESRRLYIGNLEIQTDHEITMDAINDIISHRPVDSKQPSTRRGQKQSAAPQLANRIAIDLD